MTLELEDKELDYIYQVLSARSFGEVHRNGMAHLLNKIALQVQEQQKTGHEAPSSELSVVEAS